MVAALVPLLEDVRPGERVGRAGTDDLVVRGIELLGRDRTVIDRPGTLLLGAPDGHEADAADAAHPRLDRADGHARGDRRIDGVAAFAQDPGANLAGPAVLRNHTALASSNLLGHAP